jgi:hypothetical protein
MRLPVQVAASRTWPLRCPRLQPILMESRKARRCPPVPVECAELRTYVAANDVAAVAANDVAANDVAANDVAANAGLRCGAAPCAAV